MNGAWPIGSTRTRGAVASFAPQVRRDRKEVLVPSELPVSSHHSRIELSVVVPVYNEAGNVASVIAELRCALGRRVSWEIILVDDGSTDDTAAHIQAVPAEAGGPVRLLRHAANRGQSAAIVTGVAAAAGDIIATLDGDGQNDPEDILALLHIYRNEHASGVRLVAGQRVQRRDPVGRRVTSHIANAVRKFVLGDGIADTGCGLKIFDRRMFLSIAPFDHMHRFLPALFLGYGMRVRTAPVHHRPRLHGTSKYGVRNRLWVGIVDLFGVKWLTRRRIDAVPLVSDQQS